MKLDESSTVKEYNVELGDIKIKEVILGTPVIIVCTRLPKLSTSSLFNVPLGD
jgi:hypothetical protein